MKSEDEFQMWVLARFAALAASGGPYFAHGQDFSAMGDDVPDLNITVNGREYWLELKFDRFKLLHSGYDKFKWSKMQRGQLEWLINRSRAGAAVCGILGYAVAKGDGEHGGSPYLVFHHVNHYMAECWVNTSPHTIGSIILGPRSCPAHYVKTGRGLLEFIDAALAGTSYNAEQLSG